MRFLLLLSLLLSSLLLGEEDYSDTPKVEEKVLYVSYEEVPQRVFKGQIFSLTLKTLSTLEYFDDITYKFSDYSGLEVLSTKPERSLEGKYFFDTFYFLSTSEDLRTPNITASHSYNNSFEDKPTTIMGNFIPVTTLNPPKNFSNILAEKLTLEDFKTTSYSKEFNIVVFSVKAFRANISSFYLKNITKQGFESTRDSYDESSMMYFVIIPSSKEEFSFSYFNILSKKYEEISMPIIVDNDMVSTQSDLTPVDHRHIMIKISVAGGFVALFLIMYIFKRKIVYIFFSIFPIIYIAYAAIPIEFVNIKQGSNIYLLPIQNSTIFETTKSPESLEVQGKIDNYIKVKLKNEKIGWVKNEDTFTP